MLVKLDGDRIRDYISDIGINDDTKLVSRHFNSANNNINHMDDFFGLCLISGNNENRKSNVSHSLNSYSLMTWIDTLIYFN